MSVNGTGARAVLYARVSSDDRGKDGRNLAGQLEMCREYAERKGWHVVEELAEDDRGASGAALDLPELTKALEMAAQGKYDVFVTREVDRLARGLAKQLIVEQELKQSGVKLEYALGEYDDTPEGALMKNVRAVIAEYERLKITERTSRARRRMVRKGKVVLHGGLAPYGYRAVQVDDDGPAERGWTELVTDEDTAPIVRMMFDWYTSAERTSMHAIAKRLTEMGVGTPTDVNGGPGGTTKKKGYGQWSVGTVSYMLRNETYAGRWHYGKDKDKDTDGLPSCDVPAIVSRATFEAAQERLETNRKFSKRNVKHDYLVRGRVKCGECRVGATAKSKKSGGKTYLYYRCNAAANNRYAHDCDARHFRADRVDAAVWGWAQSIIINREGFRESVEAYRQERDQRSEPLQRRLQAADKVLAEKQRKLDDVLDLYLDGHISKDEMLGRRQRYEKAIAGLQEKRAEIVADMQGRYLSDKELDNMLALIDELALGFEEAEESFEIRRQLMEFLDMQVELVELDGEQKVRASVVFGEEILLDVSSETRTSSWARRVRWVSGPPAV